MPEMEKPSPGFLLFRIIVGTSITTRRHTNQNDTGHPTSWDTWGTWPRTTREDGIPRHWSCDITLPHKRTRLSPRALEMAPAHQTGIFLVSCGHLNPMTGLGLSTSDAATLRQGRPSWLPNKTASNVAPLRLVHVVCGQRQCLARRQL